MHVYVAQAREILSSILEASVHNNATLKIGGLLCFNPDTLEVVQMLEGPTRAVLLVLGVGLGLRLATWMEAMQMLEGPTTCECRRWKWL